MNKKKLESLAKKILTSNQYLSLGTVNKNSSPWVAPVYYCMDKKYTFYYASQLKSVHSKNIIRDSRVACAIFNSNSAEGNGVGLQIAGKVSLVKGSELSEVLKIYKSNFLTPDMLGEKTTYRLFKLTPKHIYVTDPEAKVDKRVQVSLSDLQRN